MAQRYRHHQHQYCRHDAAHCKAERKAREPLENIVYAFHQFRLFMLLRNQYDMLSIRSSTDGLFNFKPYTRRFNLPW